MNSRETILDAIARGRRERPADAGCCVVCWHTYGRAIPQRAVCTTCGTPQPTPVAEEELVDVEI
jgi:hypothetical protein